MLPTTPSHPFLPRSHRLVTAGASLLALLLLVAYVAVPAPAPSMAAQYTATASGKAPRVRGEVTNGAGKTVKGAKLVLVFRARDNDVIKTVAPPSVSSLGKFSVRSPRRAVKVVVRVSKGSRKVVRTFALRPNASLEITAAIPPRGSGLLPGLFPY